MKIDFGAKIIDAKGDEMKVDGATATLGACAFRALIINFPSEKSVTAADKFNRGLIAEIAYKQAEAELSIKDISTIKAVIGLAYDPWVVMQCYRAIEGSDVDAKQNSANE